MVTILGGLIAKKREKSGGGRGFRSCPPPQEKHGGGGSEFYRILHRKISELLFIETAKNYRKPFFRYFIGLIIRKFILRLNITSDKILSYNIAAAKSLSAKVPGAVENSTIFNKSLSFLCRF